MSRSTMRYTSPLIGLTKQNERPQIASVGVYCSCTDGVTREVELDDKLAKALLGFIQHRQGGIVKMNEGKFIISREKPMGLGEPAAGMKWLERSDRRGEFEAVPI